MFVGIYKATTILKLGLKQMLYRRSIFRWSPEEGNGEHRWHTSWYDISIGSLEAHKGVNIMGKRKNEKGKTKRGTEEGKSTQKLRENTVVGKF